MEDAFVLCEFLHWDSEFFGVRIAKSNVHILERQTLHKILEWTRANSIQCLYFLADSSHNATVQLLEEHAFHFVDIRMTFVLSNLQPSAIEGVRTHNEADIPLLRQIARGAYRDSRFYYDSNFSSSRCDDLYEAWIENSCRGFADAVLVADQEGSVAGFVTCHLNPNAEGQIGLVGVAPEAQGSGIGMRLVKGSLTWFASNGCSSVSVVTQGRNVIAQRLYQKCGFRTKSVQLWYHRWFI